MVYVSPPKRRARLTVERQPGQPYCRVSRSDAARVLLQMGETEVEVRSKQDERPKRRRHNRRDDLGHRGQVGVVRVLRGDDNAEHHIHERGKIAHQIILRRAWRRSSPINFPVKRGRVLSRARAAPSRPRPGCRRIDPTLSATTAQVLRRRVELPCRRGVEVAAAIAMAEYVIAGGAMSRCRWLGPN
jgi:hypothetical protein